MIGLIINPNFQRYIKRVIFADSFANSINVASAREELFPVLMKRYSHNSISHIKSFLHTVAMMNIHIQVQYPLVVFEELKNRKDNIISVAKTACLTFFRMMQTSTPIHCYFSVLVQQYISGINRGPTTKLTKLIQSCKTRTIAILAHRKLTFLLRTHHQTLPLLLSLEHHIIGVHEPPTGEHILGDEI